MAKSIQILSLCLVFGLLILKQADAFSLECDNCAKNQMVYLCDFDTVTCSPLAISNSTQFIYGLFTSITITRLVPLSDVTSVNKAASNGLQCKIPYLLNNQSYYHCQNNANFDCRTTNDEMSKCATGRFLLLNPTSSVSGFVREYPFTNVRTVVNAVYEISFYLFYFTSTLQNSLSESIIFTYDSIQNVYPAVDLFMSPTWSRKSILFTARNTNLVMKFSFIRNVSAFRFESFFAIDQLEIKRIDLSTTSTIDSTSSFSNETTTTTTTESYNNSQRINSNSFYLLILLTICCIFQHFLKPK